MNFEIIGDIVDIETIAIGNKIRDIRELRKTYGKGRWRKRKGMAQIRLRSGRIRLAELLVQAHGLVVKKKAQTIPGLITIHHETEEETKP